ncbi:regulating synaptic membrane exocytosis protein 2-like isoform X1 [Amphibalanus amphitrite]|uniref:regulating synaptic membrane exocytosis protein 2-like isoform X1 n=2 Tax=Amphibalanus amphitrite TaxID=1232801 RepID=UPI001C91C30F|nr:regulating synaptic membrane exocytosis protein 2-like isoform X1 [Amphibalanus amphitrite]
MGGHTRRSRPGQPAASAADLARNKKTQTSDHQYHKEIQSDQSAMKRLFVTREKHRSGEGGIGMKLVGGKLTPSGETGAFVGKIFKGGVMDNLGQLKEGDEIVEWNGTCLRGKTYEEVQKILSESTEEIEILADCNPRRQTERSPPARSGGGAGSSGDRAPVNSSPPTGSWADPGRQQRSRRSADGSSRRRRPPASRGNTTHSGEHNGPLTHHRTGNGNVADEEDRRENNSSIDPMDSVSNCGRPAVGESIQRHPAPDSGRPGSGTAAAKRPSIIRHLPPNISLGQIQLQMCHDVAAHILYVSVLRAKNLKTRRPNGDTRPDPFVEVILLPDNSTTSENVRTTRHFSYESVPEWNQTMVYPKVQLDTLHLSSLQVCVWNHDAYKGNEHLGQVSIDLADPHSVDEQAHWYQLQPIDGSGGRKSERRRSDRHFLPRKSRAKRPDVLPMDTEQGATQRQTKYIFATSGLSATSMLPGRCHDNMCSIV